MSNPIKRMVERAISEGRVCSRCGWTITIKNWNKGYRMCPGCYDASLGMTPIGQHGHYRAADEPRDRTGEMI